MPILVEKIGFGAETPDGVDATEIMGGDDFSHFS